MMQFFIIMSAVCCGIALEKGITKLVKLFILWEPIRIGYKDKMFYIRVMNPWTYQKGYFTPSTYKYFKVLTIKFK